MGQVEWVGLVTLLAISVGVTAICAIGSMAKWLYTSLVDEFRGALKNAAGLATEDARLAKEYRDLMQAFTVDALMMEDSGDIVVGRESTMIRCKRISAGRHGLDVDFEDLPVPKPTRYWGIRLTYLGKNAIDLRYRCGDQYALSGDTLKMTYTLGRDALLAIPSRDADKPPSSPDPMFEADLDV